MKALFDTNILIDFLSGIDEARTELALYQDKAISIVTWMEVQVGTTEPEQAAVDRFLRGFTVVSIDAPVSVQALHYEKQQKSSCPMPSFGLLRVSKTGYW